MTNEGKPHFDDSIISDSRDDFLESLLDQALTPESPSAELHDQIMVKTRPVLQKACIARRWTSVRVPVMRIAAGVLLMVSLGLVIWGGIRNRLGDITDIEASLARVDDQIMQLADASEVGAGEIDDMIDLVDLRLTLIQAGELWPSVETSMAEAAALYELEHFETQMRWIF